VAAAIVSSSLLLVGCGINLQSEVTVSQGPGDLASTGFSPPTTTVPTSTTESGTTTTTGKSGHSGGSTTTLPGTTTTSSRGTGTKPPPGGSQTFPATVQTPVPGSGCTGAPCPVTEPLVVGISGSITLHPLELTVDLHRSCPDSDHGRDDSDHSDDHGHGSDDHGHGSDNRDSPTLSSQSPPSSESLAVQTSSQDRSDSHADHDDDDNPDHCPPPCPKGGSDRVDSSGHCGPPPPPHCKNNDHDKNRPGSKDNPRDDHCRSHGRSSSNASPPQTQSSSSSHQTQWTGTFGPVTVLDNRGTLEGWTIFIALDDTKDTPESGATIIPGTPKPMSNTQAQPPFPAQQHTFHLCDDIGCFGILAMAPAGTGGGGFKVSGTVVINSDKVPIRKGHPQIFLDVSLTKQFDDVGNTPR
jgi:hypothetical protein